MTEFRGYKVFEALENARQMFRNACEQYYASLEMVKILNGQIKKNEDDISALIKKTRGNPKKAGFNIAQYELSVDLDSARRLKKEYLSKMVAASETAEQAYKEIEKAEKEISKIVKEMRNARNGNIGGLGSQNVI